MNIESSSVKENKTKTGSSSKVSEYRYASEEDNNEFQNPEDNNIYISGAYEKQNKINIPNKNRSFSEIMYDTKFEIINENYQNGKA